MKKVLLSLAITLTYTISIEAQEEALASFNYGITINAGVNTSPFSSNFANTFSVNYSIGGIAYWSNEKKLEHGVQVKYNKLSIKLKNVPYPYINNSGSFVNEKADQDFSVQLIYIGWRGKYKLSDKSFYLLGGLGFNYEFKPKYSTKYGGGTNSFEIPLSQKNSLINRPELAVGLGMERELGNLKIEINPMYRLHINVGNSAGLMHSFGIETAFIF